MFILDRAVRFFLMVILSCVQIAAAPPAEEPRLNRATARAVMRGIPVPLYSIKRVYCLTGSGTAFLVARDTYVSAFHVSHLGSCTVDGRTINPIVTEAAKDFVVFKAPSGDARPLRVSCKGFIEGEQYRGIGFPAGNDMVVTKLVAGHYIVGDYLPDLKFRGMRFLRGIIPHGMSGGPIVDRRGVVIGINSATTNNDTQGLSRDLADTQLCSAARINS